MERQYEVGQHVKYIDSHRKAHDALVLIWWHDVLAYKEPQQAFDAAGSDDLIEVQPDMTTKVIRDREPGCNMVLVDPDPQKDDTYGRQIRRETSIVHLSNQPARANCWCWPDEVPA